MNALFNLLFFTYSSLFQRERANLNEKGLRLLFHLLLHSQAKR